MRKNLVKAGEKYGQWIVLRISSTFKCKQRYWVCRCSCGREKEVGSYLLKSGRTFGCNSCAGKRNGFKVKYKDIEVGEKINFWTVLEKGQHKYNQ